VKITTLWKELKPDGEWITLRPIESVTIEEEGDVEAKGVERLERTNKSKYRLGRRNYLIHDYLSLRRQIPHYQILIFNHHHRIELTHHINYGPSLRNYLWDCFRDNPGCGCHSTPKYMVHSLNQKVAKEKKGP
jgi:hypothetical protein